MLTWERPPPPTRVAGLRNRAVITQLTNPVSLRFKGTRITWAHHKTSVSLETTRCHPWERLRKSYMAHLLASQLRRSLAEHRIWLVVRTHERGRLLIETEYSTWTLRGMNLTDTNKACPFNRRKTERSHRLRWRMMKRRIARIASRYRQGRVLKIATRTLTCCRELRKRECNHRKESNSSILAILIVVGNQEEGMRPLLNPPRDNWFKQAWEKIKNSLQISVSLILKAVYKSLRMTCVHQSWTT